MANFLASVAYLFDFFSAIRYNISVLNFGGLIEEDFVYN